ncbi:fimbrial protein [Yersinia frederiksenii]|uniref:fimbrial protein n=1 Tax=Yersinia frederiksenii TaxID=29484 RepID=UPI0005E57CDC|nr:fimbrial protein [Yersinia frederiksenii]CQJ04944.1 P pilus assembly protein%2C pilin FimA [Yersinia frederiksenii]
MRKFILAFLLLCSSQYASAIATCTLNNPVRNLVGNLSSGFYAGDELSVGAILYKYTYIDAGITGVVCGPTPFTLVQALDYVNNTLPLSNWTGTSTVYQTSIPGVGVTFSSDLNNKSLPTNAYTFTSTDSGTMYTANVKINTVVTFVKLGPISPGTFNASTLPTVRLDLAADPSMSGMPMRVYNLSFTGSIAVRAGTCTTPDVNVPMGSHDMNQLSAIGSTTAWVDASIKLTNCPVLAGRLQEVTSSSLGKIVKTQIILVLSPTTGLTPEGYLDIDRSVPNAANGVAIQLASGTVNSPTLLNLKAVAGNTFSIASATTATTVNFPFVARYIKTQTPITPGQANGKMTFTISYL